MNKVLKIVFWIIAIIIVIWFLWYAYNKWWGSKEDNKIGEIKGVAVEKVVELKDKAKEGIFGVVSEAGDSAIDYFKDGISTALNSFGGKISEFGKSLSSENKDIAGTRDDKSVSIYDITKNKSVDTISNSTSSGFSMPPPVAAFISKIGTPIIFSINRESNYYVDWSDGTGEKGSVLKDTTKLLSHSWGLKGDYVVKFDIEEKNKNYSSYFFPIRIYE